ncbi:hypothetical protein ACVQ8P_08035 [Dellaglioa sp. BT-FLS60]
MRTEVLKAKLYRLGFSVDEDNNCLDIDYEHEGAMYLIAQVWLPDLGVIDTDYSARDLVIEDDEVTGVDRLNEAYDLLFKYTMTPIDER